ncbi:MAG: hypothetical protein ABW174_01350 [Flavitalea sp.]
MKKLIVVLMALGLAFGASAQRGKAPVRVQQPAQRVVVVRSYPPFSPFYGYGRGFYGPYGFGNSRFGYDPYGYGYRERRPSKLDLEIEDIQNDYKDRIASVRSDDELSRKEKRSKIQELKYLKEKEIIDAKKSYYKTDRGDS